MARRDPLADPGPLIRRVYSYVAYRIGDGPEAEDVTSEAFERALRYRSSYDSSLGGPLPWLIGIARRCIDGRRSFPLATDADQSELAAPGNLEEATLDRLTLAAVMAALPERDRELLALRYGADLSARQIGAILGRKPNAVDVALHRALARLRALLEDQERSDREVLADRSRRASSI
jgi:RNA polymerase sigma-70 factor (ECF subfamily)